MLAVTLNKIGIIPARLHSTRFPKKILTDINGKPMVIYTAEQVSKAKSLDRVFIAIDSDETYQALKDFNYELVMTSNEHKSGTDRIAEVVKRIKSVDIIVNIQADEPFINPILIDRLTEAHLDSTVEMSTLVSTQLSSKDYDNENIVKAFLDENNFAIDFKRKSMAHYKHLGIYGFTRKTLLDFISFEQTANEKNRHLEQMRALDNAIKIKAVLTDEDSLSINILGDLLDLNTKESA